MASVISTGDKEIRPPGGGAATGGIVVIDRVLSALPGAMPARTSEATGTEAPGYRALPWRPISVAMPPR